VQKRIERAWTGAKAWITDFTGAPNAALLVNAPAEQVAPGLGHIAQAAQALRITIIPTDKPSEAQFVELDSVPTQVERLLNGELAELSANWATQQAAFDLDLHLIVHPLTGGQAGKSDASAEPPVRLVSLELDWWSDQVFSDETDNPAQFAALAAHFIELQGLFAAANLFISAESGLDPGAETDEWVEV
jgi:hypothetical protein